MLRITLNYMLGAQQRISDSLVVFMVLPIATKKFESKRKNLLGAVSKEERDGSSDLWHHLEILASTLKYP